MSMTNDDAAKKVLELLNEIYPSDSNEAYGNRMMATCCAMAMQGKDDLGADDAEFLRLVVQTVVHYRKKMRIRDLVLAGMPAEGGVQ